MNERDSELVVHDLVKNGYELASSEEGADIVLLNTCSVREQAELKAIGKANHIISKNGKKVHSLKFLSYQDLHLQYLIKWLWIQSQNLK